MNIGFVKVWRSNSEAPWWKNPIVVYVWLYIMMHASYEDSISWGVPIKAGQLITGLSKMSKDTGISVQRIRTALSTLISTGYITKKSTSKYTIITLTKWGVEQGTHNNQQANQQDYQQENQQLYKNKRIKRIPPIPPPIILLQNGNGGGGTNANDTIPQAADVCETSYIADYIPGMSASNWKEVDAYLDNGLTMDLIKHAVDEACAHDRCFWGYVRSILNRYLKDGITTVEQAKKTDSRPADDKPSNRWLREV